MSTRFYCAQPAESADFRLSEPESRHLERVARHRPGDLVEIFDGQGSAWLAVVIELGRQTLVRTIQPLPHRQPPIPITLASACPKGERMDWLVEKTTELGVERLIPLSTERSIVDPRDSKLERLRKTIIETCKQCRRNRLMDLAPVATWAELLESASQPTRLLADPSGVQPDSWPILRRGQPVILAVGPEGGWTEFEIECAVERGWQRVALGVHTLRIETAAIALCAALTARVENFNE